MQSLLDALTGALSSIEFKKYAVALLIFVVGYALAKLAHAMVTRRYGSRLSEHGQMVVGKLLFYVIFLVSFFYALSKAGVNLSGLLAAAGVATVAISFAAQTSVSNVISGIFLLFDRPFSLGDTIKVDLTVGNVLSMGMLSSKVRTFDNLVVRIPNEVLLKSTITNYSLLGVRRVDVPITIAHENNLYEVQKLILDVARQYNQILDEPEPVVLTDLIQDQGITLIARVWVERQNFVMVRSELSTRIIDILNTHEIKRPVMQRTVRLAQDQPIQIAYTQKEHALAEHAPDDS